MSEAPSKVDLPILVMRRFIPELRCTRCGGKGYVEEKTVMCMFCLGMSVARFARRRKGLWYSYKSKISIMESIRLDTTEPDTAFLPGGNIFWRPLNPPRAVVPSARGRIPFFRWLELLLFRWRWRRSEATVKTAGLKARSLAGRMQREMTQRTRERSHPPAAPLP